MPKNKPKYRKKGHARPKYIENADELAANEEHFRSAAAERRQRRIEAGAEDEDDEDDDEDDEEDEDDVDNLSSMVQKTSLEEAAEAAAAREARAKLQQNVKINVREMMRAGQTQAKSGPTKMKDLDAAVKSAGASGDKYANLTRKEREELEAKKRKAHYEKMYALGKTADAKADKARLEEIKKRRAEAKKRREEQAAEDERVKKEEKQKMKEAAKAEKKASKKAASGPGTIESRVIKKMKPPQLKEALKERGLDIQGNKKQLVTRLLKWCEENA